MASHDSAISAAKPYLQIRPSSGWPRLRLREVWDYRDLLLTLTIRDVKVRYKQTVLGATWVVLQPLIAAAIFAFVFGRVANLDAPGGVPYFLFAFAGLVGYGLFSNAVNKVANVMVGNSHLVSKVYFPRLVLPLATLSSPVIDFLVAFGVLVVGILLMWHLPAANVLLMPATIVLLLSLALGIGLVGAALAVRFRDVLYMVPVLLQLTLYASPVAYTADKVPEAYRELYFLNPLVAPLEAFRWSLLSIGEVPWGYLAYSAVVALVLLVVGIVAFSRMERSFADVI